MIPDPIHFIESRVAFGLRHADELAEAIAKFCRPVPTRVYQITHIREEDDWFVGLVSNLRVPGPHIGVIAGEAVNQFNNALDNLLTAMLRSNGIVLNRAYSVPSHPPTTVTFGKWPYWPSASSREAWERQEPKWRTLLSPEHFRIVAEHQPFRTPAAGVEPEDWTVRDIVTRVRRLANTDKHEAVHVGVVVPKNIGVGRDPRIQEFDWLYEVISPLANGMRLYRARYTNPHILIRAMVIEPDVAFEVEPGRWYSAEAFRLFGEAVMNLVTDVRRATPNWRLPGL